MIDNEITCLYGHKEINPSHKCDRCGTTVLVNNRYRVEARRQLMKYIGDPNNYMLSRRLKASVNPEDMVEILDRLPKKVREVFVDQIITSFVERNNPTI